MKIWRIQNEDGQGPYYDYMASDWWDEPHKIENGRPDIYEDRWRNMDGAIVRCGEIAYMLSSHPNEFLFGFMTTKQLKNWFSAKELARLALKGFYVVAIDAQLCYISQKQCIVKRKR